MKSLIDKIKEFIESILPQPSLVPIPIPIKIDPKK